MQLTNECPYADFALATHPNKAYDAINDLLEMFKQDIREIPNHLHSYWYTLAKFDEYAHQARATINTMDWAAVLNHPKMPYMVGLQPCEKYLTAYQETVNLLGNNLQCASSAVLLNPKSFFMNLMPIVDNKKKCELRHYDEIYYVPIFLLRNTERQLKRQSKCVNPSQPDNGREEIKTTALMQNFDMLKSKNGPKRDADKGFGYDYISRMEQMSTKLMTNYLDSKRAVSRCARSNPQKFICYFMALNCFRNLKTKKY